MKRPGRQMGRFRAGSRWMAWVGLGVVGALALAWGPAWAQDTEIFVLGSARVIEGNVARAKQVALSRALAKGVEYYLLNRLGDRLRNHPLERLLDRVLPKAHEEVQNYHIIAAVGKPEKVTLLVKVRINEKILEKTLQEAGLLDTDQRRGWKVLFLVADNTHRETPPGWWQDPEGPHSLSSTELVLFSVFEDMGMEPIRSARGLGSSGGSEHLRRRVLRDTDCLQWGVLTGARLVIAGETRLEGGSLVLDLKAYDTIEGRRICSGGRSGEVAGGEAEAAQTLERMVRAWAEDCLGSAGLSEPAARRPVQVILQAVSHHRQIRAFRDYLRSGVRGIRSVRQTRIRRDAVFFEVHYPGTDRELAERILGSESTPFPLKLLTREPGRIVLTIR